MHVVTIATDRPPLFRSCFHVFSARLHCLFSGGSWTNSDHIDFFLGPCIRRDLRDEGFEDYSRGKNLFQIQPRAPLSLRGQRLGRDVVGESIFGIPLWVLYVTKYPAAGSDFALSPPV